MTQAREIVWNPYWKDSAHFDQLIKEPERLDEFKLFGGGLIYSHTVEYLILLLDDDKLNHADKWYAVAIDGVQRKAVTKDGATVFNCITGDGPTLRLKR